MMQHLVVFDDFSYTNTLYRMTLWIYCLSTRSFCLKDSQWINMFTDIFLKYCVKEFPVWDQPSKTTGDAASWQSTLSHCILNSLIALWQRKHFSGSSTTYFTWLESMLFNLAPGFKERSQRISEELYFRAVMVRGEGFKPPWTWVYRDLFP